MKHTTTGKEKTLNAVSNVGDKLRLWTLENEFALALLGAVDPDEFLLTRMFAPKIVKVTWAGEVMSCLISDAEDAMLLKACSNPSLLALGGLLAAMSLRQNSALDALLGTTIDDILAFTRGGDVEKAIMKACKKVDCLELAEEVIPR